MFANKKLFSPICKNGSVLVCFISIGPIERKVNRYKFKSLVFTHFSNWP